MIMIIVMIMTKKIDYDNVRVLIMIKDNNITMDIYNNYNNKENKIK